MRIKGGVVLAAFGWCQVLWAVPSTGGQRRRPFTAAGEAGEAGGRPELLRGALAVGGGRGQWVGATWLRRWLPRMALAVGH